MRQCVVGRWQVGGRLKMVLGDEGVLWCFSHVKRMEKNKIVKWIYVGEFTSNRSVGRLWKRSID